MRFKLLILMMFGFCATAFAQIDYYAKKADYLSDTQQYLKKAENYDREAEYYNNKATSYLREAEYHTRKGDYDYSETYINGPMMPQKNDCF